MRVLYVPVGDRAWAQHFSQRGGGFHGMPYQRGGGLGSLFRSIFRAILPVAKTAGRAIGKRALKAGAEMASDLVAGKNFKQSLTHRGKAAASDLLSQAADGLKGGHLGKRKKRKTPKKTVELSSIKGAAKKKPVSRKRKRAGDQLGVYFK